MLAWSIRLRRILARGDQAPDHARGNGCAAVERHALQLLDAGKRHDAAHDGHLDTAAVAPLAEPVEVLVVKEQLRDEEVRTRIDLGLEAVEIGL
jgi:hypothetical protein